MELDHEFTVPVPVERAWSVLLDVERVALCMPGATLDSADGEEYQGRLKVRVGAMTITYRGTARIVAADEGAGTLTIDARGKEARGSGTANATVQAKLREEDGTTHVSVRTKLNVTGRPAQFGRNILSEVGGKLVGRFAKALAEELESSENEAADPTPETSAAAPETSEASAVVPHQRPASPVEQADPVEPVKPIQPVEPVAPEGAPAPVTRIHPRRADDAIDLLEVAGPSVAKRVLPVAGAVAFLLAVLYVLRRRRR
ncbi:SRPBCC family protein [Actinomadura rupiterrae]|uniref:SRPBCC family protein n=1 Tax=Actinomadura rupiterrae TaxID=559627 RepID=UPI0020A5C4A9|nr:SRPBCC domain-containing protein [Actinomadura rupiterrae]MCP2335541.1 carbon monoxide dehydrogenase subunit G [Actinomadura rupiterrae]